jgi:hypothetical protein
MTRHCRERVLPALIGNVSGLDQRSHHFFTKPARLLGVGRCNGASVDHPVYPIDAKVTKLTLHLSSGMVAEAVGVHELDLTDVSRTTNVGLVEITALALAPPRVPAER